MSNAAYAPIRPFLSRVYFPRRSDAACFWTIAVLLTVGIEVAAMLSRGDANWDLRNYHLYAPFALLHKPFGVDIAPAHMQTYFSPTFDLLFYALASTISSTPVLNALISLPHAAALVLTLALLRRLLRPKGVLEYATIFVFLAISATGVANTSTLATTMSEMLPASLIIAALLLLVPEDLQTAPSSGRLLGAGVLLGCACGLKLTMSYVVVALALSLILIPRRSLADIVCRPALLGVGVVLGAVALSGYWWVLQWERWGNPFFPLMNQIFHAPGAVADSFVDRTFLPRSAAEALAAPWMWALRVSGAVSESRLRDSRFSLALLAACVCIASEVRRRHAWPILFLSSFFVLGFFLWRLEFSIYRYLAPLEMLSGGMMALAVLPVSRALCRPRALLLGSAGLLAGLLLITVEPNQYRAPPGTRPFEVDLGALPPDSLILALDHEPVAYLAAFVDPRIRFVGTNDFFMTLDSRNPLQVQVRQAIETHPGSIWGLDCPTLFPHEAEQTLASYHLAREACREVRSNVSPLPIRLCRLHRDEGQISSMASP